MRILPLLCLLTSLCFTRMLANVGDWNVMRSSNRITEVAKAADSLYYVLADGSLSLVDVRSGDTPSVLDIGRHEGLNSTVIRHIAFCQQSQRLIIVYKDFNIDLLDQEGEVLNLPDYMNKTLYEKKDVSAIYIEGVFAYLKTSFGYLKIDTREGLILDTLAPDDNSFDRSFTSLVSASVLPSGLLGKGPLNNFFYHGIIDDGRLLTVPGIWRHWRGYVEEQREGEVFSYDLRNQEWSTFDRSFADTLSHRYIENSVIAADPIHENRYAVAGRTGLYIFDEDTLTVHYNYYNSPLQSAHGEGIDPVIRANYTISEGITYDADGNLWILNDLVDNNELLCLTAQGEWEQFEIPAVGTNWGLCSPVFDRDGHLWFLRRSAGSPYICCFDPKSKGLQLITSITNQNGATFGSEITYDVITEGPDDRLWIGTNMGLIYVRRSQKYGNDTQNIQQYVVPRNDGSGLGDYLLAGVRITDIKFDAANRMWVSTFSDGVYLVSADLNSMEQHFTVDNSMLPTNQVWNICIDHESGIVYFLTDEGLVSYESDASQGAADWNTLYCYPNPVRTSFNGKLTICGMKDGAQVYITDSANRLVYQTVAAGGTVRWDLCDSYGNRVDPGIYLIHGIDEQGKTGAKCKVLIQ